MAKLLVKTEGLGLPAMDLRLGVNRVGREPECEFCLDHPTISSLHCELALSNDGVYVRDCSSTNGTFINGQPVMEAWLDPGQTLRLGDVELFVESTEANIAIPKYERPRQVLPPPVVRPDGVVTCRRHAETAATFRCPACQEVMCNACIHVLRRRGGPPHFMCILCSHECDPIRGEQPKKKKGFFGMLQDTVKLKFKHPFGGAEK
jgi:pSer/pThr/pTyr-binding forkhead associated (FHA) protein